MCTHLPQLTNEITNITLINQSFKDNLEEENKTPDQMSVLNLAESMSNIFEGLVSSGPKVIFSLSDLTMRQDP